MAATDILTEDEALAAVNLPFDHTIHLAKLRRAVSAVSSRIDALCGPVVIRTVTGETHDLAGGPLILWKTPVAAITTLTEYSGTVGMVLTAENFPSAVTANDYRLDGLTGIVERRSNGYLSTFGFGGRVVATYQAGRYATTAAVDPRFKQAAAEAVGRVWQKTAPVWAQTPVSLASLDVNLNDQGSLQFFDAVDPVVRQWLSDELVGPVIGAAP